MAALSDGRAQVVELAAERRQAVALGREPGGGRISLRLKLDQRLASRFALDVEFLGTGAMLFEAGTLFEQPSRRSQTFEFGQLDANRLIGFGLFGLAASESQLPFDFRHHVI